MYDFNNVSIPEKFKNHPLFSKRIKGMNFGFLSKRGYYAQPEMLAQPEKMAEMGVNCVTLNQNIVQDHYYSTDIRLDLEWSVGDLELKEMADRLHSYGIMVLFKPCMTCLDGQTMGSVTFPEAGAQINGVRVDYWKAWFESYRRIIRYSADLAERLGFDGLMLGAENLGTEHKEEAWHQVIADARSIYGGPMTYEFTFASRKKNQMNWLNALDFLSYSYYPPACPPEHKSDPDNNPDYTYEDMFNYLLPRRERIVSISERFGNKPILFTEYGVRSSHGSIQVPWNFMWKARYDGKEQADFMKASWDVFKVLPQWMGWCWWKWDETQLRPHYFDEPGCDKGFTIQGKPAEQVWRSIDPNEYIG